MSVPHLQPVHASRGLFFLVYCNLRRLATSRLRDRLRVKASDVSRLREHRRRSERERATTRSGPRSKLTGSKTWEGLDPAKQRRYTCSGPQQTHKLWEVRFEFLATCLENQIWLFEQANHGAYSNFGTQVGAQTKDFGAVSQTLHLTRV